MAKNFNDDKNLILPKDSINTDKKEKSLDNSNDKSSLDTCATSAATTHTVGNAPNLNVENISLTNGQVTIPMAEMDPSEESEFTEVKSSKKDKRKHKQEKTSSQTINGLPKSRSTEENNISLKPEKSDKELSVRPKNNSYRNGNCRPLNSHEKNVLIPPETNSNGKYNNVSEENEKIDFVPAPVPSVNPWDKRNGLPPRTEQASNSDFDVFPDRYSSTQLPSSNQKDKTTKHKGK